MGSTKNFSIKISSFPKAFKASALTKSKAGFTSSSHSQRRIPRPPPPAAAFKMIGKPKDFARASASSASFKGSVDPGMVGTPASKAISLAFNLSPILPRTSLDGPIKVIPASSQARAKSAFSDKKP